MTTLFISRTVYGAWVNQDQYPARATDERHNRWTHIAEHNLWIPPYKTLEQATTDGEALAHTDVKLVLRHGNATDCIICRRPVWRSDDYRCVKCDKCDNTATPS